MNGLHDGCEPAAEVVGGVGPDLRGLLQNNDLGGAVEQPGEHLAQLHLQLGCRGGEDEAVSGTATAEAQRAPGPRAKKLRRLSETQRPALTTAHRPPASCAPRLRPTRPGLPQEGSSAAAAHRGIAFSQERRCPGRPVGSDRVFQGDARIPTWHFSLEPGVRAPNTSGPGRHRPVPAKGCPPRADRTSATGLRTKGQAPLDEELGRCKQPTSASLKSSV